MEKANRFIEGWSADPGEGTRYKTRRIGIGHFHSQLDLSLQYEVRDPVLRVPSHLVFLGMVFRSAVSLDGVSDPSGIRIA